MVRELDRAEPTEGFEVASHFREVWLFVHDDGHALGIARLEPQQGRCSADQIRQAVDTQLETPLLRHRFRQRVAPALDPGDPRAVSVAICTRDRPEELARCLEASRRLDPAPVEILVVDNAPSSHATRDLLAREFPSCRYVLEPEPGLDYARNRAILEARGEILAFTDDDAIVDPGWVRAIADAFALDPEIVLVTGLVLPFELETRAQGLFEDYGVEDQGGFRRGTARRWFRASANGRTRCAYGCGGSGYLGTGANMAFRRAIFERIGGFDPALDVGTPTHGGGDLEMFYRIFKAGGTVVYEPRARVWHRHRRTRRRLARQLTAHGVGLTSHFTRSVLADPSELGGFVHLLAVQLRYWSLPRIAHPPLGKLDFPVSLTLRELIGLGWGPLAFLLSRTRRPRSSARPAIAPGPPPPLIAREIRPESEAVRQIELSEPLPETLDLAQYEGVRLVVTQHGEYVDTVRIKNFGAALSRQELADTLAAELAERNHLPCADRMTTTPATRHEPSHSPAVSIVIATADRPAALRRCLTSLTEQTIADRVEILVVDNHPVSDITSTVVREFSDVRLVEETRKGLSFARNAGIREARAPIIVTTDDDVVAPPRWLELLVAPFSDPAIDAVTGNVLPLELETRSQRLFEEYGGLGRGARRRRYDRQWLFESRFLSAPTWQIGATANAAFRKEIFERPDVGPLCEYLGAGMPAGVGEDTFLFYRLLRSGGSILYEPRAWLWHEHRKSDEALRRQIFDYSRGHVAYHLVTLLRHGDLRAFARLGWELPRWHVRRLLVWRFQNPRYPLHLIALEAIGQALGPFALARSWWRARRLRSRAGTTETSSSADRGPSKHS